MSQQTIPMPENLRDYPAIIQINVQWGEMDAYQHVNNTVFFRYFESARIVYLEKIQFVDLNQNGGLGPILGHTQCKFIRPLTYPDTILVGARTSELRDDRFVMDLKIYSTQQQAVAAVGTADMVIFDYRQNRKAALPDSLRARISEVEGRSF
ncbi:MAG: thioesterase family protein [candidate division KSB1 bacterium]|nr:thioesterase family protein [candidate division KSB1 bacterium]